MRLGTAAARADVLRTESLLTRQQEAAQRREQHREQQQLQQRQQQLQRLETQLRLGGGSHTDVDQVIPWDLFPLSFCLLRSYHLQLGVCAHIQATACIKISFHSTRTHSVHMLAKPQQSLCLFVFRL
jgi:hypothetical protein